MGLCSVVVVVGTRTRVVEVLVGERVRRRVGDVVLGGVKGLEERSREVMEAWGNGGVTKAIIGVLNELEAAQRVPGVVFETGWRGWLRAAGRKVTGWLLVVLGWVVSFGGFVWNWFPVVYLLVLFIGSVLQCAEGVLPPRMIFWHTRNGRRAAARERLRIRRAEAAAGNERVHAIVEELRVVEVEKVGSGGAGVYGARSCAICLEMFGGEDEDEEAANENTPLLEGAGAGGGAGNGSSENVGGLRALACGHVLHARCIVLWLSSSSSVERRCPICRGNAVADMV